MREWTDAELLEELGTALRHVAMHASRPPGNDRLSDAVDRTKSVSNEISRRRADTTQYLDELSNATGWRMTELHDLSVQYPERFPYVKTLEGVRLSFKCKRCGRGEHPEEEERFYYCTGCLEHFLGALDTRPPSDEFVVYRAYSSQARCQHADDETVLIQYARWYEEGFSGACAICLRDAIEARHAA